MYDMHAVPAKVCDLQGASPAALTVAVRKPCNVSWDVWTGWSEAAQLAYVNAEDLANSCGVFPSALLQ
jgi:hypothetical protein